MGSTQNYKIVVYNDDSHTYDEVVQIFIRVFGYDVTRAANCALIINNKGSFVCKSTTDAGWAMSELDALKRSGLKAELESSL